MPIELKGQNYYSKVFEKINYKLSNSTFWVVISILHATSYYGKSGDPKSKEQWDIERVHDVPQQKYE